MGKLAEAKGEEALDLLAEIFEPAIEIMGDQAVAEKVRNNDIKGVVPVILKSHKEEVLQIMAIDDGLTLKEEKKQCNILALPVKIIALLNNKELLSFFQSQVLTEYETPSTHVTESTEGEKK